MSAVVVVVVAAAAERLNGWTGIKLSGLGLSDGFVPMRD
jgi:hypothetical protein